MNMEKARFNMVEQQIRPWQVSDEPVLDLFASIPREKFVSESQRHLAFADLSVDIDHGQKMYAPKEDARLLQALRVQPEERVLEIGTGSGYLTAMLASLSKWVTSIDIYEEFLDHAKQRFSQLGLNNISLEQQDHCQWLAPDNYEIIVITPALQHAPMDYIERLSAGNRLVYPHARSHWVELLIVEKMPNGELTHERIFEFDTPGLVNETEVSDFVF